MKTKTKKGVEKFVTEFTELMIKKIEDISSQWSKPWFVKPRKNFIPQNINGRPYGGGNLIMLLILSFEKEFNVPIFLTFAQASERDIQVLKGAKSFPVYYYIFRYYHPELKVSIDEKEFEELSESEQQEYVLRPTPKHYRVFNLEQTNYPELFPKEWADYLKRFEAKGEEEMNNPEIYANEVLDDMLQDASWVCPISIRVSDRAYFSPTDDRIVMPMKNQFIEAESFYSTLLHEMTHSTGTENRLNRLKKTKFGSAEYAREELVAELSAALTAYFLGIHACIQEENAAYLKSWIKTLQEKPEYLLSILQDVVKAATFISKKLDVTIFEKYEKTEKSKIVRAKKPEAETVEVSLK